MVQGAWEVIKSPVLGWSLVISNYLVELRWLSGWQSFSEMVHTFIILNWHPIKKITPLSFPQLSKLKKMKCLDFLDQTSFEGDMSFLTFCDRWFDNGHMDIYFEITKILYLSNMMTERKNKVTLFSSTLKVKEIKVYLFSWSEFIVVSYCNFVISWTYWKTPHKSKSN